MTPDNQFTPLQRFWNLLGQYKKQVRLVYFYAFISGIVSLTIPLAIKPVISFLQSGEVSSSWIFLTMLVLSGVAFSGFIQVLQLRVVENIQQDIFVRSSFDFAFRLPKIKHIDLNNVHNPELVNRFFDTLTIQKGLPKILIDFSLSFFQILLGIIILTVYSPLFAFVGIFLFLIVWFTFWLVGKKALDKNIKESSHKYRIAFWLEEIARVNRVFKMNTSSQYHINKTDEITTDYINSREGHFKFLIGHFSFLIFAKVMVAASLFLIGGILVFHDQMNIGEFVAAEIIVILIISSIEKIISVLDVIYDVLTALEKLGYVTDKELDTTKGTPLLNVENQNGLYVAFENLTFQYPTSYFQVIKNLNAKYNPGDKVVIEGDGNAGKSTLLHLIAGFYHPNVGSISINDRELNYIEKSSFYKQMGMVLPTNQLFEGSILENITVGNEVDEHRMSHILEVLYLKKFIDNLPEGIHTPIDSEGRKLPRNIIQKLSLARAIVHKPKLLLLEDPLIYINTVEKKAIIDYMMSDENGWTLFVIANDEYWQSKATYILELKDNS